MPDILSFLENLDTFQNVPKSELQWFVEQSTILELQTGDFLFKAGEETTGVQILLEGSLKIYFTKDGRTREFGRLVKGDLSGKFPYSRMKTAGGYGEALEPTSILIVSEKHFPEMIKAHQKLTEAFVHNMLDRTRSYTTMRTQDEKLLALGRISAGLAHELNNPISAIVRGATELRKYLKSSPDKFKKVMDIQISSAQVDLVNRLLYDKLSEGMREELPLLEKTDQEDEMLDWLEERFEDFEDVDETAETLVEFGFETDYLEEILEHIPEEKDQSAVIHWLVSVLTTEKFVCEIQEASNRVSKLVKSIKEYSYMDRSHDRQDVNIHHGIRNSATILGHKFKRNKVQFIEDFSVDMPLIKAFPGELNQVWTNIIDNAIDAMEEEGGTLKVETTHDAEFARINIIDDGPGIPADVIGSIFDPFFTTKEMGKGTGIGLDVVHKIMEQHRGDIKVESKPGRTAFKLCFPING